MLKRQPNLESLYLCGMVTDASESDQGFALPNLRKLHTESMELLKGVLHHTKNLTRHTWKC